MTIEIDNLLEQDALFRPSLSKLKGGPGSSIEDLPNLLLALPLKARLLTTSRGRPSPQKLFFLIFSPLLIRPSYLVLSFSLCQEKVPARITCQAVSTWVACCQSEFGNIFENVYVCLLLSDLKFHFSFPCGLSLDQGRLAYPLSLVIRCCLQGW